MSGITELEVRHVHILIQTINFRLDLLRQGVARDELARERIGSAFWIKERGKKAVEKTQSEIDERLHERNHKIRTLLECLAYFQDLS
jgi:hypothetical protein